MITRVQAQARERILRLFKRRELLSPGVVDAMREWSHAGGFSLNADVTVPAWDRSDLERLLRYCARPIFAGERLQWSEKDQRLLYCLLTRDPMDKRFSRSHPWNFWISWLETKGSGLIPLPVMHGAGFEYK